MDMSICTLSDAYCSLATYNSCGCSQENYCYWINQCTNVDGIFPLMFPSSCPRWNDPTGYVTKHPCQPKYQNPTFAYSWDMSGPFNPPTCSTLVAEYCTNPPTCDTPPTGCFCPECTEPSPGERFAKKQNHTDHIIISPVPANNKLIVSNLESGEELTLNDIYGKIIKRFIVSDNSIEIQIGNLPEGVYFIHTTSHKVSKFVKYN